MPPNKGTLGGLHRGRWQNHTPELIGVFNGATPTQPDLGANPIRTGRFLHLPEGLVVVQGIIAAGAGATAGTASSVYLASLPVPAARSSQFPFDRPIGSAHCFGPFHLPSFPLCPSIADPFVSLQNSNVSVADGYVQFFTSQQGYSEGTATITAAATSVVVPHTLGVTPKASDITVTSTNNSTTATGAPYITAIDATNFTINVRTAPGASTATYAWKVSQQNSATIQFLGANVPLPLATYGFGLEYELVYEPR